MDSGAALLPSAAGVAVDPVAFGPGAFADEHAFALLGDDEPLLAQQIDGLAGDAAAAQVPLRQLLRRSGSTLLYPIRLASEACRVERNGR